jgi:DNA-binding NtrC family response regulator
VLEKILIVDDDEMVLSCFGRLLGRHFSVETALGPQRGIEALVNRGPFAVVLSDMRMPGLSGIALLEKAKELSPLTVGLILTGNSEYEGIQNALKNGTIFRLLQKPCPSAELMGALEDALALYRKNIVVAIPS